MLLHISIENWDHAEVTSFSWQLFSFLRSSLNWPVPIFVMISGALFLTGNISTEKIYKKNILRIITAFIFWSPIYALLSLAEGSSIMGVCAQTIQGHYHMWFLFMIVGLYLIVPFVKRIVESQMLIKYFLALGLVFTVVIPQGLKILGFINESVGDILNSTVGQMNFYFTLGYIFYFVLGYYLSKTDISKRTRCIIYILSILGFVSTIFGTSFISIYANEPKDILVLGNFNVNIMLQSLGVFVFMKYNVDSIHISDKMKSIIGKLSKYSFGAYLVHAMVLEQLRNIFGLDTLSFNPVLSILVIMLIVSVVSFLVSWICNHIPVLNKYIV